VPQEHQSWSKGGSGARRPHKEERETESPLLAAPMD